MGVLKEWVGVVFMQGKSSLFGTGVLHVFFPAWSRAGCEMPSEFSASPGSVAMDRFS